MGQQDVTCTKVAVMDATGIWQQFPSAQPQSLTLFHDCDGYLVEPCTTLPHGQHRHVSGEELSLQVYRLIWLTALQSVIGPEEALASTNTVIGKISACGDPYSPCYSYLNVP